MLIVKTKFHYRIREVLEKQLSEHEANLLRCHL